MFRKQSWPTKSTIQILGELVLVGHCTSSQGVCCPAFTALSASCPQFRYYVVTLSSRVDGPTLYWTPDPHPE
jgi:hypothetical protein